MIKSINAINLFSSSLKLKVNLPTKVDNILIFNKNLYVVVL